jgi:hypothetical protein
MTRPEMWSDHWWPWTQRITGLPHALILIAYPGDAAALLRLKQRPEQQTFAA